jgi:hypothetical protein
MIPGALQINQIKHRIWQITHTQTTRTQINHFFASIYASFKQEKLKLASGMNHFALKSKLYVQALKVSIDDLQKLQTNYQLNVAS